MRHNLLLAAGADTRVGAAFPAAAVSSLLQNAEQVNAHSRTNSSSDSLGIVCFCDHNHEQRSHRQEVSGSGRGETTSHFVCCLLDLTIKKRAQGIRRRLETRDSGIGLLRVVP
jgi:hypothetical protein